MNEQILILLQIIFIDLVLAGDNAVIIGMVASQFEKDQRKKIIFWGIGAAVILRIIFTLIASYLLQINGLRLIGGLLLLYIVYKLYVDVIKEKGKPNKKEISKEEAEKILKEAHKLAHEDGHNHDKEKKEINKKTTTTSAKENKPATKKAKLKPVVKKVKKVSKK